MAKAFIDDINLSAIGNAIRSQNETNATYYPSEMADAILALPVCDTSDATATEDTIIEGNTAYVKGEKVTGKAIDTGNYKYLWKKHSNKIWEITETKMGTTQPSDCSNTKYKSYIITDDGYFKLSSSSDQLNVTLSNYYYISGQSINSSKSIYKSIWEPNIYSEGGKTTYYLWTLSDTYTEGKGRLLGYVSSDSEDTYPVDGIQDGYYYVKLNTSPNAIDTSDATAEPKDIINLKTAYVNGKKIVGTLGTYKYVIGEVSRKSSSSLVIDTGLDNIKGLIVHHTNLSTTSCTSGFIYDERGAIGLTYSYSPVVGKVYSVDDGSEYISINDGIFNAAPAASDSSLPFITGTYSWVAWGEYSGDYEEGEDRDIYTCGTIIPESTTELNISTGLNNIKGLIVYENPIVEHKALTKGYIYSDVLKAYFESSGSSKSAWYAEDTSLATISNGNFSLSQISSSCPFNTSGRYEWVAWGDGEVKINNTSDANAIASDILSGKTAYVNGSKVTGTIPSQAAQTITPGTSDQTIVSGKYLSGTQTIKGDSNLVASNIKSGVSIFGVNGNYTGNGTDTSDATATASDIASGKTAYINGELVTGTIKEGNPTHRAGTPSYNPTTYVNLISIKATSGEDAIIRSGSEFSATASASEFGNATVSDVAKGKTFTSVNGLKLTGTHECSSSSSTPNLQSKTITPSEEVQNVTADSGYDGLSQVTVEAISSTYVGSGITKKAATTYTPSTSNQTIASGTYLSGAQTIKGDSNLVSGNIKSGVSIFGVSGSYTGTSSGSSSNNCEAYHITSTSATLNFSSTGTVKVYGYGYKSGTYTGTMYSFVGDGYYTSGMYGTPSKTNATFSISSSGTLSGLPSGLTTVNLLVEIGV